MGAQLSALLKPLSTILRGYSMGFRWALNGAPWCREAPAARSVVVAADWLPGTGVWSSRWMSSLRFWMRFCPKSLAQTSQIFVLPLVEPTSFRSYLDWNSLPSLSRLPFSEKCSFSRNTMTSLSEFFSEQNFFQWYASRIILPVKIHPQISHSQILPP